jgi:hypothetical protein
MPDKPYLSFEIDAAGEQLFIHADPAGLRLLASRLAQLAERVDAGGADHLHFFTETWGDGEISDKPQSADCRPVHHVKLLGWPPAQA